MQLKQQSMTNSLLTTTILVFALQTAFCRCDPLTDALNSLTSGLTSGVTSGLTNGVLGGLRDTLGGLLGGVVTLPGGGTRAVIAAPAAASATPPATIVPGASPSLPMPAGQMGYMMTPYGMVHQYQHQSQHQQASGSPFSWMGRGDPQRKARNPWILVQPQTDARQPQPQSQSQEPESDNINGGSSGSIIVGDQQDPGAAAAVKSASVMRSDGKSKLAEQLMMS